MAERHPEKIGVWIIQAIMADPERGAKRAVFEYDVKQPINQLLLGCNKATGALMNDLSLTWITPEEEAGQISTATKIPEGNNNHEH